MVMARFGLTLVGWPPGAARRAVAAAGAVCTPGAEAALRAPVWPTAQPRAACGADLDGSAANPTVVRRSVSTVLIMMLVNMFPSSLLDFFDEFGSQSVKFPVGDLRVVHGDKDRHDELGQDKQIAEIDDPDQLDFKQRREIAGKKRQRESNKSMPRSTSRTETLLFLRFSSRYFGFCAIALQSYVSLPCRSPFLRFVSIPTPPRTVSATPRSSPFLQAVPSSHRSRIRAWPSPNCRSSSFRVLPDAVAS